MERKIYLFSWRPAILRFKYPKKLLPAGDDWPLKLRTLEVKGTGKMNMGRRKRSGE
jgi:hypothetical protein